MGNFIKKVKSFFLSLPMLIMDSFFLLLSSFGIILLNVVIIMGIKSTPFNTILKRPDIMLCMSTTIVCFLVAIIFTIKEERKMLTKFTFWFTFIASAVAIILMIQIEGKIDFNKRYIEIGLYITFLFTILITLISKYDESKIKDREYGQKSRDLNKVEIGGKNLKL